MLCHVCHNQPQSPLPPNGSFFFNRKRRSFWLDQSERKLEVVAFLNAGVSLGRVKQGKLSLDVFLVTVLLHPLSQSLCLSLPSLPPSSCSLDSRNSVLSGCQKSKPHRRILLRDTGSFSSPGRPIPSPRLTLHTFHPLILKGGKEATWFSCLSSF